MGHKNQDVCVCVCVCVCVWVFVFVFLGAGSTHGFPLDAHLDLHVMDNTAYSYLLLFIVSLEAGITWVRHACVK